MQLALAERAFNCATILREHGSDLREIDVVCINVERWELEVLGGLSFDLFKPKVLIIENLFLEQGTWTTLRRRVSGAWFDKLPVCRFRWNSKIGKEPAGRRRYEARRILILLKSGLWIGISHGIQAAQDRLLVRIQPLHELGVV